MEKIDIIIKDMNKFPNSSEKQNKNLLISYDIKVNRCNIDLVKKMIEYLDRISNKSETTKIKIGQLVKVGYTIHAGDGTNFSDYVNLFVEGFNSNFVYNRELSLKSKVDLYAKK